MKRTAEGALIIKKCFAKRKKRKPARRKQKLCTGKLRNPHKYVDRNIVKIRCVVILNPYTEMNISSLQTFNENCIYYLIFE
jgi:hypothetical protein